METFSLQEITKLYSLLASPIYIFNLENCQYYWANDASLPFFNASTLAEVLDYKTMMPPETHQIYLKAQKTLAKGGIVFSGEHLVTIPSVNPKVPSKNVLLRSTLLYLDHQDKEKDHPMTLCEVVPNGEGDGPSCKGAISESALQSIEILRHLPIAVQQYSSEGVLQYQNPRAINTYRKIAMKQCHDKEKEKGGVEQEKDNSRFPAEENKVSNDFIDCFVDRSVARNYWQKVWTQDKPLEAEVEEYTVAGPRWHAVSVCKMSTTTPVVLHTAQDITETVKARQQASEAAVKCEFMDMLAHEIRTPLHQIIGYMDLLCSDRQLTTFSQEQREYLQLVQTSTEALMAIINDLLDYSKLENGKLNVETIPFDLSSVLVGCVATMSHSADEKGIELRTKWNGQSDSKMTTSHMALGDPNRIRQICLNLLSNAIKFTEKGSVTLEVEWKHEESKEQRLHVLVKDTGIGIEESQQQHLFQKYCQANSTVARNFGGTGLGLAICKGLVETMGGSIGMKSKLHEGTTVYFEIPLGLAKESSPKAAAVSTKLESTSAESTARTENHSHTFSQPGKSATEITEEKKQLHILVAEDNLVNQRMVAHMLKRLGHTSTVASHGQEAVDLLYQQQLEPQEHPAFDLIFMDVQMPVLDGIEATQLIRRQKGAAFVNIPIIGLTASFQNSQLDYFRSLGMSSCIGKPATIDHLRQVIDEVVFGK